MIVRLAFILFLLSPMFIQGQSDSIPDLSPERDVKIIREPEVLETVDSNLIAEPADTSLAVVKKKKINLKTPAILTRDFYRYKDAYPNPKASLALSLILPGAGQVYNKKYWKVPLIYAGLGGMIYMLNDSSNKYLAYRTAYKRSIQNLPYSNPLIDPLVSSQAALKIERDKYDERRTRYYFGAGIVYGLFALEAFVDAHLQSFDISKDLSMDLRPKVDEQTGMPLLSLQFQLNK